MKKKRDIFFPLFIYVFRKPFCFKVFQKNKKIGAAILAATTQAAYVYIHSHTNMGLHTYLNYLYAFYHIVCNNASAYFCA